MEKIIFTFLLLTTSIQLTAQPKEYNDLSGKYILKYTDDTLRVAIFHPDKRRARIKYVFSYHENEINVQYRVNLPKSVHGDLSGNTTVVDNYWIAGNKVLECYGVYESYVLFYDKDEYPKESVKISNGDSDIRIEPLDPETWSIVMILNRELDRQNRKQVWNDRISKWRYYKLGFVLNANKDNLELNRLVEKYLSPD